MIDLRFSRTNRAIREPLRIARCDSLTTRAVPSAISREAFGSTSRRSRTRSLIKQHDRSRAARGDAFGPRAKLDDLLEGAFALGSTRGAGVPGIAPNMGGRRHHAAAPRR